MTRVYYREAVGAFVVFDCTRPRTFDSVRLQSIVWRRVMLRRVYSFCAAFGGAKLCMLQVTKWKQDIDQKVLDSSGKPVPVVLLMVKPPRRRGLCARSRVTAFAEQVRPCKGPVNSLRRSAAAVCHRQQVRSCALCPCTRLHRSHVTCSFVAFFETSAREPSHKVLPHHPPPFPMLILLPPKGNRGGDQASCGRDREERRCEAC